MPHQNLSNNAHLSKLSYSYFENSSHVHQDGFAPNFPQPGLSKYPKHPMCQLSSPYPHAASRSFDLHCSSVQFVRPGRQKFPKKMAKQLHVSKCHSLNCDCVDMSSHLGCCCCEFESCFPSYRALTQHLCCYLLFPGNLMLVQTELLLLTAL